MGGTMLAHRLKAIGLAVAVVATGALTACGAGPTDEVPTTSFEAVSSHETSRLNWEKSWDSAFSRAKSEGKPVLVSFEAEWCVWCKKLDSTTYRDTAVMSLISDSMVPLILDVDGAGQAISDAHGVESLPTVLVFSPSGEEVGRINGYLPPGRFVEVMHEILHTS
jgi:thiol:disulfide interchange protein DsbD